MTTPASKTSKVSKTAAPFLPYRKIFPADYLCPIPEYRHDDMLQAAPVNESGHLLEDHFADQPHTLVDTGGFVFYDPADMRRRRVRPDVYVVFGVDTAAVYARDGYIIAEAGKPPDFALEVASRTTSRYDTGEKRELYEMIGVGEYWRFDHTGGRLYGAALSGDLLVDGAYQPIPLTAEADGLLWGYSAALDLCLCAPRPAADVLRPQAGGVYQQHRRGKGGASANRRGAGRGTRRPAAYGDGARRSGGSAR